MNKCCEWLNEWVDEDVNMNVSVDGWGFPGSRGSRWQMASGTSSVFYFFIMLTEVTHTKGKSREMGKM